jgi:hypothetical protein
MNMKRLALVGIAAILLLSVVLPSLAYAVPNQATDVEITPKISVKGSQGQGKSLKQAATGVLGTYPAENRYAIVIGISDYSGEENDLDYADDDAKDMFGALIYAYGYSCGNIILLIDEDAKRENILSAISSLNKKAKPNDEIVFFYSGHGARGKANDGDKELIDEAIVPWECTAESLIWDGELAQMFFSFATSRIIFIFDSCYAGGMTDLKADGKIVVMACSESGLSYEFETLENGQFTYYFVEQGITGGKADIYDHVENQADVTIEEAFDYAKAN